MPPRAYKEMVQNAGGLRSAQSQDTGLIVSAWWIGEQARQIGVQVKEMRIGQDMVVEMERRRKGFGVYSALQHRGNPEDRHRGYQ